MTLTRAPVGSLLKQPLEQRKKPKTPLQKRDGKDPAYIAMLRHLPSCVSGQAPVEIHHLKSTGERGGAMKSPDKWGLPLTPEEHREVEKVGSKNEVAWFQKRGVDPLSLASALWANKERGLEEMLKVLQEHKRTAQETQ